MPDTPSPISRLISPFLRSWREKVSHHKLCPCSASCSTFGCMLLSSLPFPCVPRMHLFACGEPLLLARRLLELEGRVIRAERLARHGAENTAPVPRLEPLLAPDAHAEQSLQARDGHTAQGRAFHRDAEERAVALHKEQVTVRLRRFHEGIVLQVDAAQRLDA